MKKIIGLTVALLLAANVASGADKIHIYTEQHPPYSMTSNGQPFAHSKEDISGLCTNIVKGILRQSEMEFSIKLRDLSYGISRARRHPDHGIYCVSKTEDRETAFDWVGPLASIQWTLFAKEGTSIKLNNLEDARKYKIGGNKGDVMATYLEDAGFNVSTINNNGLNARRLQEDQIDLWVADGLAGPYLAADVSDVVEIEEALVFRETPMYLAINKETDPSIVQALKASFQKLVASGELETMKRAYGL